MYQLICACCNKKVKISFLLQLKSCALEEGGYCEISTWGQYIMRENIGGCAILGKTWHGEGVR